MQATRTGRRRWSAGLAAVVLAALWFTRIADAGAARPAATDTVRAASTPATAVARPGADA